MVWAAGNQALETANDVPDHVRHYVGIHLAALFGEITRQENEMEVIRSMDVFPADEVTTLDMGALHFSVKQQLATRARQKTLSQMDPADPLFPESSLTPQVDRMPAWSNDTATMLVQKHLEDAYQQLASKL